jgi:hypothetical protein
MKPKPMNPLIAQLTHQPFPEVAEILRIGADQITLKWDTAFRLAMPQMRHLTFDELKDSTPQILLAIAHALASDDARLIDELVKRAPAQGLSRLKLNFDVIEIMQEDRLLRSITVAHVNSVLGRRMELAERDEVQRQWRHQNRFRYRGRLRSSRALGVGRGARNRPRADGAHF